MSDSVMIMAIVETGLVLATLGIVAIVYGRKISASVSRTETTFHADGEPERKAQKSGKSSTRRKARS
jgi:hypothetical protein